MSYRNKTYVAFASEDIKSYYLMEAWRENEHIDFDFFDAHDLYVSRDSSQPETIKRNLRARMTNAKQVVLLGSLRCRSKGSDGISFLAYEVDVMMEFNLPIVVANLNGERKVAEGLIPAPLLDTRYFTVSVSFQPAVIKYALDNYVSEFASSGKKGPHRYNANVYANLGL